MNFAKELKWRLDAFHDGILAKTTIIDDMDKIAKQYAEEMCKKQKRADHAFGNDQLSGTEMSIDLSDSPLATEKK